MSIKRGEVRKPVWFNLGKPDDLRRLDFIDERGIKLSPFLKSCIDLEMALSEMGMTTIGGSEFKLISLAKFYIDAELERRKKVAQHSTSHLSTAQR